jgi:hypothetical protein
VLLTGNFSAATIGKDYLADRCSMRQVQERLCVHRAFGALKRIRHVEEQNDWDPDRAMDRNGCKKVSVPADLASVANARISDEGPKPIVWNQDVEA